jgi:hypothetical protein
MNELLRRSVPCTSGVPHFAKERADLPFGPKLTHIRQIGPLQPQELYRTQQYATTVYRSELAHRLQELGYEIEHGKSGQPEIKGYSREYLDASSPRRKQIKEHLAMENQSGAAAAEIAAHHTREAKIRLSHEEMQQRHNDMAIEFGDQPERVKADQRYPQCRSRVGRVHPKGSVLATSLTMIARDYGVFVRPEVSDIV